MDLLTPPSTSDFSREVVQPGPRYDLGGIGAIDDCVILVMHSSRLGKGPEVRLPSSSIAYQPGLMPRMSDLSSPI